VVNRTKETVPPGWIIAIRVTEKEKELDDYLLLPTSSVTRRRLLFTEATRGKYAIERFESFSALAQSLLRHLRLDGSNTHASQRKNCAYSDAVTNER
jgi:hypothetical protein